MEQEKEEVGEGNQQHQQRQRQIRRRAEGNRRPTAACIGDVEGGHDGDGLGIGHTHKDGEVELVATTREGRREIRWDDESGVEQERQKRRHQQRQQQHQLHQQQEEGREVPLSLLLPVPSQPAARLPGPGDEALTWKDASRFSTSEEW